jgi:protein TonB
MEDDNNTTVEVMNLEAETGPSEEEEAEGNQIFTIVEQQPEFPGGETALLKYLSEHIKYPAFAQENGIQGRVTLSFTVEKDGSIANIEVMRSPADELSKEAVRVVSSMPKWKPGKQRGKPVRVKYVLPVVFRLN